jgi:hypothetical protein
MLTVASRSSRLSGGTRPAVRPVAGGESGGPEALGVIGARQGLGNGSSETFPAAALFRASGDCEPPISLQIATLGPAEGSRSFPRSEGTLPTPPGDRAKPSSSQAFSGRSARMAGWVPGVSNGPASRQFSGEGPERPNQSSARRRWEQRHAGPRTPLRENEWRPRANYNEKEYIKCRQVEYDSC